MESDYEDNSAEDVKEDSDPDFMDVDVDEVEETKKKKPTKAKASTKRANVTASSSATVAEGKSKATPAKIDSEEHEGGKPTPKFKCATSYMRGIGAKFLIYHSWAAAKAAKMAGPSHPGSKVVPPSAAPDCLAGLSFVFTGELSAFSREEAIDLAKRFCGCVLPLFFAN